MAQLSDYETYKIKRNIGADLFGLACAVAILLWWFAPDVFSGSKAPEPVHHQQASVTPYPSGNAARLESSIRKHYDALATDANKQSPETHEMVGQVEMHQTSATHFEGSVDVEMFGITVTRDCSANIVDAGNGMRWSCVLPTVPSPPRP